MNPTEESKKMKDTYLDNIYFDRHMCKAEPTFDLYEPISIWKEKNSENYYVGDKGAIMLDIMLDEDHIEQISLEQAMDIDCFYFCDIEIVSDALVKLKNLGRLLGDDDFEFNYNIESGDVAGNDCAIGVKLYELLHLLGYDLYVREQPAPYEFCSDEY